MTRGVRAPLKRCAQGAALLSAIVFAIVVATGCPDLSVPEGGRMVIQAVTAALQVEAPYVH